MQIDPPGVFWMVAGPGPTSARHNTKAEAEREAKRLARTNLDQWFVVVQSISAHRKSDVQSVSLRPHLEDDGIPF